MFYCLETPSSSEKDMSNHVKIQKQLMDSIRSILCIPFRTKEEKTTNLIHCLQPELSKDSTLDNVDGIRIPLRNITFACTRVYDSTVSIPAYYTEKKHAKKRSIKNFIRKSAGQFYY